MRRRIQVFGFAPLVVLIASASTVLPVHAVDQNFDITFNEVVSPNVPDPGAGNIEASGDRDIYTFTAAANQVVFIDRQGGTGLSCLSPTSGSR